MKQPLVSIIVPVYNNEIFLSQCMESILGQDYTYIEIIAVDDGSTDDSANILNELAKKDKRLHVYSKANNGVSSARNFGIKKARGDYIFFVDSDDCIAKNCISYLLALAEKNNSPVATVPMPNKFTGKDSLIDAADLTDSNTYVISGEKAATMMLSYKIVISSWGKLFSKEIIEKNKICFDESLAYGEGFLFSVACFLSSNSVAIGDRKVYNYRLDNATSAMTKYSDRMITDSLSSLEKMGALIKHKNRALSRALSYAKWHTYCDCYNTIVGAGVHDSALKKQLSSKIRRNSLKHIIIDIPVKDKIKCVLFFVSPYLASIIINSGRKRSFTKCQQK